LFHRPKNTDFPALYEMGCTHVVTLLKESEGAARFGTMTQDAGMEWVWLPVPNGKYPEGEVHRLLLEAMPNLSALLDEGKSILIHCSAGIHRTGTVAYALLRWRGMNRGQAMKLIGRIRRETAEGMLEKRMRWGDENARPAPQQELKWIYSAREFVNRLRMKLSRLR
jgi:protein-tyrosine phosphatase